MERTGKAKIIRTTVQMQQWSEQVQKQGETICLVPTMGYFHQGHLSLMDAGKSVADHLVVSLFVNPTQFGANEDFGAYPKNFDRDFNLAESRGAAVVFAPDSGEIYPPGFQTSVVLSELPRNLCGLSRPVHFQGVATVVTKLFNIVKPRIAVFGCKDYQQLQVIRQLVKDLNFNIIIMGAPIVREVDGLAMSSRNVYLSPDERKSALSLSSALTLAERMIKQGETRCKPILAAVTALILDHRDTRIDYATLCDPETLNAVDTITSPVLLALAVKVGTTRLIDNRVIDPGQ
ncbi:MAG: pantoate--beta-alanine ligase [Desulfobacterium sp.]|jgi:pantoate--beta-alanine ligase|nr:pantoate--beta-alanine ligase [Desulfobacterium sp.]